MDQKTIKWTNKGWNIWKRGLGPKILVLYAICFAEFKVSLPGKEKSVCQTKLAALAVTICIWKNLDTFEIIQKIGSHLEKSGQFLIIQKIGSHLEKNGQFWNNPENWQSSGKFGQFWTNPENWQSSGKIRIVLKNPENWQSSGKYPDSFEIIRKIGNHLEKIRTVLKPSRKLEIIWKNTV